MDQEPITDKQEMEETFSTQQERIDQETMKRDRCPWCLIPTADFPYFSGIPPLGWFECPFCGIVFSPKSVREAKLRGPSQIIKPNIIIP